MTNIYDLIHEFCTAEYKTTFDKLKRNISWRE